MSSYKPQYKSSGKLGSSKLAQKKRKKTIAIVFLSTLCAVTLIATCILLLQSSLFQVTSVVVQGPLGLAADLPVEEIKAKTLELIAKNPTNIFFLSKDELIKHLAADFPEINTVSITRSGFHTLKLSAQERIPVAIVCFGFLADNSTAADGNNKAPNCYYSDRHGYVFSSISSSTALSSFTPVSASVSLPSFDTLDSYSYYYVPTDKGTSPLGTTFIDENRFDSLEQFVNGAHAGGLSPLGVLIGDNGEYEMYIKNRKEDSEVTVYFDDKIPFSATLSNLLTFWDNPLAKNNKKATTTSAFDYINLRFGNTVYYSTH